MSDITNMSTYKTELNKFKIPTELVGGEHQLVKPYFDIDTELPKDTLFDKQSVVTMAIEKIKKIFKLPNSKDIYILQRDCRGKNGKHKYSYHIMVDNISITNLTLKNLLLMKILLNLILEFMIKTENYILIIDVARLIKKKVLSMFPNSNLMMFLRVILKMLILLNITLHISQKVL